MNPNPYAHGWIATDLDGTLFARSAAAADAVPGTWAKLSGTALPSSWVPAATHRFLLGLSAQFPIVPVTARDWNSYQRVEIPGVPFAGAVLANGAILQLPSGEIDTDWSAVLDEQLAEWEARWAEIMALLSVPNVRPRLVASAGQHAAYLVAKAPPGWWESQEGLALVGNLPECGLRFDVLGSELQALPPCVSKAQGVQAFMSRYTAGVAPLLALGDMPADAGFMKLAAFQGAPTNSTLAKLWKH